MRFTRQGQGRQLVFFVCQDGLDHTVHKQIGVTANGAGEVRVGLIGQAKMTTVDGGVNGLLHGAQQHGVNLLRVRPLFGGLRYVLKLTGLGFVTHGVRQTQRL